MSKFKPNKRHLWELLIYFFDLKKSAAEAHRLLIEAYNEAALSEMIEMNKALKEKGPQYYSRHDKIILLQDNARPHVAVTVKNSLKTLDWEVLPHPPHSPDVAPAD
ncbi:Mariner Mos1 transposase [Eumeta japonica]|uniref:Mariner Mos1 transposase n=1 Tax=Eumeta variegata TaxID=151549 RepID=A0A4C1Y5N8_EUMVA|nr:Mariner Mos1 transposase [Eumeta japonica]